MSSPKPLNTIFQYIGQNQEKFLQRLKDAIAISSVPTIKEKGFQILTMINWTNDLLKSFGVKTELKTVDDERYVGLFPLPPVLFGNLETGCCPNKPTLLLYSQLDVNDAKKDGWKNDPFELYQENDNLFGRGIMEKSCLVTWLNILEAYKFSKIEIPVNIKFIFDSMGTENSPGLKNLLMLEKDNFLAHVDYICLTKGSWLQNDVPCIISSFRGICCFSIEVESSSKNMNSNICCGMIQEAMTDLFYLLKLLTDDKGELNIEALNLEWTPILSEEEMELYENCEFDLEDFKENVTARSVPHGADKKKILERRIGLPLLTIHGIESSCVKTNETEIPGIVIAKISIRTVYNQKPEEVFDKIQTYLENAWLEYGSLNKLNILLEKSANAWKTNIENVHQQVGVKSYKHVYTREPIFLKSGYVSPIVNMFSEVFDKNIIVLPIGPGENYDTNEKLPLQNFYSASKVFAAYLYELGDLPSLFSASSTSFKSCKSIEETCVCGRFGEKIYVASGDADICNCANINKFAEPLPVETGEMMHPCCKCCLSKKDGPNRMQTSDKSKCKCLLKSNKPSTRSKLDEVMSLASIFSIGTNDLTQIKQEEPDKIFTPSIDTIKCTCVHRYENENQEEMTPERENELMKSMRSFGSKISGNSACLFFSGGEVFVGTKTKNFGCICPEKSAETVVDFEKQFDRMTCTVKTEKEDKKCVVKGKRKYHVTGPKPIEDDGSEITIGPFSHCSCDSEELTLLQCDCGKKESVFKIIHNLEGEVD